MSTYYNLVIIDVLDKLAANVASMQNQLNIITDLLCNQEDIAIIDLSSSGESDYGNKEISRCSDEAIQGENKPTSSA